MKELIIPVYDRQGKQVDSAELDQRIFGEAVNVRAIYQAVKAYRANQRQGLASTKTRGEVSGGGRKPWRQKGTGRARVGSIRSPLWRHGGVIFGPHPRDFSYSLPKKIKALALRSAVNAKVKEENMVVIDALKLESPKTKEAAKILSNLKIGPGRKKVLLLLEKSDDNLKRSLNNLSFLKVSLIRNTNVYEVLAAHKLLITRDGLKVLAARMKK